MLTMHIQGTHEMSTSVNPIVIWRLLDGKPGHETQTLGLVKSLQRHQACESFDIRVSGQVESLFNVASATWPFARGLPLPDLIVGAGHRTHLPMLAARRAYGGKAVVLMQPSLPVALFDLCLIPQHDRYRGGGNYIETRGVLNPLHAEGRHEENRTLIMIGGPSRHYGWDTVNMLSQIRQLLAHRPWMQYTLTTSRRTPADFIVGLHSLSAPNLRVVPFSQTQPGWVAEQLAQSATAWVSEDSVSMVYEALTAQVAVGLLNLPLKQENRVSRGVEHLLQQGMIVRFDSDAHYQQRLHPVAGFTEADRCANWILRRWLQPVPASVPQVATATIA